MKFKISPWLIVFFLLVFKSYSNPVIRASIFGDEQHFWKKPEKVRKFQGKISVLPVYVSQYKESIPCDSCHWLSRNSLEFVLDNYLLRLAESESRHYQSELIHPENQFLIPGKLNLEKMILAAKLPWDKIFYGFTEKLIFRKKDSFTPVKVKKNLNQLGGQLGGSHLLMIQDFKIKVYPIRTNGHMGKLEFRFYLLFWNVELAYPEWVIFFKTKTGLTDLDVTIDKYLDKKLTPFIKNLPEQITRHKLKEAR